MLVGIALAIYISVTVIFWRNVKLAQPWKAIFSFTICPLFVYAMVFNLWFTNHYAGWLLDLLASAKSRGGGGGIVAFMVSTPIAAAICIVWYGLMRALDALTGRSRASKAGRVLH